MERKKLGMSVLPISGGMTVRQVDLIIDFKPEVICCSPSYALQLQMSWLTEEFLQKI